MKRLVLWIFCTAFPLIAWAHDDHHTMNLQPGDEKYRHDDFHHAYKRLYQEVNAALEPGDENYRKDELGDTYQHLYDEGKCACKSGYCRPTKYRRTELGADSGWDVIVNRVWVPVPLYALHHEGTLSRELFNELMATADAHVCAYTNWRSIERKVEIECAIVPEHVG